MTSPGLRDLSKDRVDSSGSGVRFSRTSVSGRSWRHSFQQETTLYDDDLAAPIRESAFVFGDEVEATYKPPAVSLAPAKKLRQWLHLSLFGIVGCWFRIALEDYFKFTAVKVATSDTSLFLDLPGNIIGCFAIGLFASASSIGRGSHAMAILPRDSFQQANDELQLGLRTGFCGALTTFASWNQQMIRMLIGLQGVGQSVGGAFFGYAIGAVLGLSFVPIGEAAAMFVCDVLDLAGGQRPMHAISEGDEQSDETGRDRLLEDRKKVQQRWLTASHVLSALACAALVAGLLYLFIMARADDPSGNDTAKYLALLLAPVGVLVRYELGALLNGKSKRFFYGTFAANILACFVDGCASGVANETKSDVTAMACAAIQTGFGGCCSTVSTMMTDTIKLFPLQKGDPPFLPANYLGNTMAFGGGVAIGGFYLATAIQQATMGQSVNA